MSTPSPASSSAVSKLKVPHVMALLTIVVGVMSVLSWVIPSGAFTREKVKVGVLTKELVVPGSYRTLEKIRSLDGLLLPAEVGDGQAAPVSLLGFLSAIPRGLEQSADIIFFIFMMGGVFGILQSSGAITAALGKLTEMFADRVGVLVVLLGLLMGAGGSTLGMGEEFIPLVPLFLMLSSRLGYDRVFGLAIVVLAPGIGFAAATTNPFTVNIAQKIAELPLNSGWQLRVVFFSVCMAITLAWILRYGAKIKADPSASVVADVPHMGDMADFGVVPELTGRHIGILAMCGLVFTGIMVAVQTEGWWLAEMGGGFFLMGILAAVIGGMSLERSTAAFTHGMKDMVVAALVVGFARGIVVVMNDAQILDTLVHAAASLLDGASPHIAVQGMLVFQSVLNVFVPSGSGQAAVTMPLMAPLADLLGITRQTAVLAYQCGDGFSNMVIPTSGTLMAMLLMAGVPYDRWLRFALPLVGMLLVVSACFLAGAVALNYQ